MVPRNYTDTFDKQHMRGVLEQYVRSKGLDPLIAEHWYSFKHSAPEFYSIKVALPSIDTF